MLNNITYKKILAATIDKLRTHNVTWLLAMNTAVLLGTLFAPMYFVVIALCILRREKLIAVWCDFLDRPFPWLPVLPLLIYPIWAIKNGGFPPSDDLLRHVTSWSHGYDYNKIYHNLKEVIPHKSMWWAFELLTGKINSSLGLWPSVFIVQGASYIIMSIICIALARKLIPKTDGQAIIKQTLMVCLIISTGLFFRSTLARPEVFLNFLGAIRPTTSSRHVDNYWHSSYASLLDGFYIYTSCIITERQHKRENLVHASHWHSIFYFLVTLCWARVGRQYYFHKNIFGRTTTASW